MRVALFAAGPIGIQIADILAASPADLRLLVEDAADGDEPVSSLMRSRPPGMRTVQWPVDEPSLVSLLMETGVELAILAWWPRIIGPALIGCVPHGFVNLHPSLLPNGRGKDPNFWSIVDHQDFGVTMHLVDGGIDTGPILAQRQIPVTWEDTGQSLYERALVEIPRVFEENLDALLAGTLKGFRQDPTAGNSHRRADLAPASHIGLDATYRARDLLNLIRARTFDGHPGASFEDDGERFEIRISIQRTSAK